MSGFGDGPCGACGEVNTAVWFTDDVLWNEVMGGSGGLMCIPCFIRRAEEQVDPVSWRLIPVYPARLAVKSGEPNG